MLGRLAYFLLASIALQVCGAQKELGDVALGCPQSTYYHDGKCYIVSPIFTTYEDAELLCETGGGTLAAVKDLGTHLFLQRLRIRKLMHRYWIGINDRRIEGEWLYPDGTRLQGFTKWHRGEPNNSGKSQHCAAMWLERYLEWDDEDCTKKLFFICEYSLSNCTKGGVVFGQSCYETSQDIMSYDDADHLCRTNGGTLAAVKTEAANDFLKRTIYAERWWANITEQRMQALFRENANRGSVLLDTWIGVKYNSAGEWVLSDGSPVLFNAWAPGEPNNARGREDCVKLGQNWFDVQCDIRNGFICQYEVRLPATLAPATAGCSNASESESDVAIFPPTQQYGRLDDAFPPFSTESPSEENGGETVGPRQGAIIAPDGRQEETNAIRIGVAQFSAVIICCVFMGMILMVVIMAVGDFKRHSFRYFRRGMHRLKEDQDLEILQDRSEHIPVNEYAYKNDTDSVGPQSSP